MKHSIRIISLISALCLIICLFSGCGDSEYVREYKDVSKMKTNPYAVAAGEVAKNSNFTMEWNPDNAVITFTHKDGTVWSTTPKDYMDYAIGDALNMYSPVTFFYTEDSQEYEYQPNDVYAKCVAAQRYTSEKINNGIRVSYYFDEKHIIIPISYYLEDDHFKVSVDPKTIKCYGEPTVISVTPAPYMCAAMNTPVGDKSSYLVVPSGSGALMYIDQRNINAPPREISASGYNVMPLYGHDHTEEKYFNPVKNTDATLPLYGIKTGDTALCAIVEQSAEACNLVARAGDIGFEKVSGPNGEYGFSYIAASYKVLGTSKTYTSNRETVLRQNELPKNLNPVVISYYALSGDDANYAGMAKCYREYLTKKEGMKKSEANKLLNVKFIGSYLEDDLFLGLPTTKDVALTTYGQAEKILGELKKVSGGSLSASMYGYGEGGINGTQIAGGYSLTGAVGDDDDLEHFVKYAKDNNIKTFFNFDTVVFYESGNGYNTNGDTAVGITGVTTPINQYWHSTADKINKKDGGYIGALISRRLLEEATGNAVALAKEFGITSVSFDTLAGMCYSDFVEDDNGEAMYPNRNNMANDVKKIIANTKKENQTVMVDGAFAYAAAAADYVGSVPTDSTSLFVFDKDVPLYQMVFQGYKALSVDAINMAVNPHTQYLKAIECGTGLSFTLIGAEDYSVELRKQFMRGLNVTLYEDNKEFIAKCVKESQKFLTKVKDQTIKSHEYVTDDVVKTVFENNVTVYVNYGSTVYNSDLGAVQPNSFVSNV